MERQQLDGHVGLRHFTCEFDLLVIQLQALATIEKYNREEQDPRQRREIVSEQIIPECHPDYPPSFPRPPRLLPPYEWLSLYATWTVLILVLLIHPVVL